MNKATAIERLNYDKKYEDKLIIDLTEYFMDCLNDIPDISETEKEKIKLNLNRIIEDSKRHSMQFTALMDMVLEDANDKF